MILTRGRALAAIFLVGLPAQARTLEVGPGKSYAHPSDAAAAAMPGDRVTIAPGEYFDCAVWPQSNLLIEGDPGSGAVITDKTCQGKALFVIQGNDVTVRNLTLTRARVPDGNGAGIRAEGRNLLVEHVRFVNNQDGILAHDQPEGTVRIEHCVFDGNGVPGEQRPTAAVIAGRLDRLSISDTRFEPGRGGAVVVSAARVTEMARSHLALAQAPRGASVQVSGGLLMEDSVIEAGPLPCAGPVGVLALADLETKAPLVLRSNRLENDGTLLLNWSGVTPRLEGNQLRPGSELSSTSGAWSHRFSEAGHQVYASVRHLAGALRHRFLALTAE